MIVRELRERQIHTDEAILATLHEVRRDLTARIMKIETRLEREKLLLLRTPRPS